MTPELIAEARQERILAAVRRDGVVSVRALVVDLGVSPITVRRDINRLASLGLVRRVHGGVAAATRRRAVPGIRGLTLGMVVPLDHYWTVVAHSAQEEAVSCGARFVLREAPARGSRMQQVAGTLIREARVDGLIVAPPVVDPDRTAMQEWLSRQATCTVLVERAADVTLTTVQSVGTDNARGAALAAQHLHDLGHRRVALLGQPLGAGGLEEIAAGWNEMLAHLGIGDPLQFTSVYAVDPRRYELFARLITDLIEHRVTGVLVAGHPQAVGLAQACHEHGIDVPGRLSIVACGDTDSVLSHPPLTAVRPPREFIGRRAVQLLGDHLRGGPDHQLQHILARPSLVVRDSTTNPVAHGQE